MSEAIVLQTYPLKESDSIVSFFTRDAGKLRGVAKRARRPKSLFGAGLERLSHVKMAYFERENRELVNLDSCDLLQSQFAVFSDYAAAVSLDYLAEVSEQILPPHEPNEKYFRLMLAVLEHIRTANPGAVWRGVTYFTLWAVKLAGLLPDSRGHSRESRMLLDEMLRNPIAAVKPDWQRETGADLRRFLQRRIESHIERRLITAPVLEAA